MRINRTPLFLEILFLSVVEARFGGYVGGYTDSYGNNWDTGNYVDNFWGNNIHNNGYYNSYSRNSYGQENPQVEPYAETTYNSANNYDPKKFLQKCENVDGCFGSPKQGYGYRNYGRFTGNYNMPSTYDFYSRKAMTNCGANGCAYDTFDSGNNQWNSATNGYNNYVGYNKNAYGKNYNFGHNQANFDYYDGCDDPNGCYNENIEYGGGYGYNYAKKPAPVKDNYWHSNQRFGSWKNYGYGTLKRNIRTSNTGAKKQAPISCFASNNRFLSSMAQASCSATCRNQNCGVGFCESSLAGADPTCVCSQCGTNSNPSSNFFGTSNSGGWGTSSNNAPITLSQYNSWKRKLSLDTSAKSTTTLPSAEYETYETSSDYEDKENLEDNEVSEELEAEGPVTVQTLSSVDYEESQDETESIDSSNRIDEDIDGNIRNEADDELSSHEEDIEEDSTVIDHN